MKTTLQNILQIVIFKSDCRTCLTFCSAPGAGSAQGSTPGWGSAPGSGLTPGSGSTLGSEAYESSRIGVNPSTWGILLRDWGALLSLRGAARGPRHFQEISLTTRPSLRGPESSWIFAGSPPTPLPLLGSVGAALPLNILQGSSRGVGMLLLLVLCRLRHRLMTGEGGEGPRGWLERVKYSQPSNPHHSSNRTAPGSLSAHTGCKPAFTTLPL